MIIEILRLIAIGLAAFFAFLSATNRGTQSERNYSMLLAIFLVIAAGEHA